MYDSEGSTGESYVNTSYAKPLWLYSNTRKCPTCFFDPQMFKIDRSKVISTGLISQLGEEKFPSIPTTLMRFFACPNLHFRNRG